MPDGGHRGKAFLDGKNTIADSCINGIKRDESLTHRLAFKVQGLNKQDFFAFMRGLLLRGDDVPDDSCYNHRFLATKGAKDTKTFCDFCAFLWLLLFNVVNDGHDRCLRRDFLRFERERRFSSAAYINRFTGARAYGIDCDD